MNEKIGEQKLHFNCYIFIIFVEVQPHKKQKKDFKLNIKYYFGY